MEDSMTARVGKSKSMDAKDGQRAGTIVDSYSEGPTVEELTRWFTESEDSTDTARRESERDRDYYDGKQWTPSEIDALRKRKQPIITIPRIQRKIDYLLGVEMKQRTDPKAFPRTQKHEEAADCVTDGLRYVADSTRFNGIRSKVWSNMMVEGFGGAEVGIEQSPRGDMQVTCKWLPWDRIWFDPHSRECDFSDARYIGLVVWMDEDSALELFPDSADIIAATMDSSAPNETYDDKPRHSWGDQKRRRVRIASVYYQKGSDWNYCVFTAGGHLVPPGPSPYVDEFGRPTCAIKLRSAYVDRDNNRYGLVRSMIGLQDEINKRRSKALHLMSVRQTAGPQGGVLDVAAMKSELARPDGHVEYVNQGAARGFEILPTSDMAASQFSLLQQATAEMDLAGPNAAMAGKDPREQSGRAIIAQQQGGAVELEHLSDGLRMWARDIYEAFWHRIKQYWTAEQWVRVMDDEDKLKWVGFNVPVTLAEYLGGLPMEERAAMAQQLGVGPGDPRLEEQVSIKNDLSEVDVDILIEEGPDVVTLASEQFEMLASVAQIAPQAVPPEVLIRAMPGLRNRDQILERMEAMEQASGEAHKRNEEIAGEAIKIKAAKATAEVELVKAEVIDELASAEQRKADAAAKIMVARARLMQPPAPPGGRAASPIGSPQRPAQVDPRGAVPRRV